MSHGHVIDTKVSFDPVTKIWSGSKSPLPYGENDTIGKVVLEAFLKDPNHISQICHHNGKQYTNQEMASLSIRVAQHFEELGLKENDVIGICACNSDFVAPLVFGAMLEGCVISSLDPSFEKDGIKHIFSMTQPKIMFCDGFNYGRMKEALDELGLNIKIYTMYGHLDGVGEITEFIKETGKEKDLKIKTLTEGGNHLAFIVCSSGTTGLPKGVCLSHLTILNAKLLPALADDVILCFSTLYWISGILCLTIPSTTGATRIISTNGFSPKGFFEIIQKYKVTSVFSPPSQIALFLSSPLIDDYDFSSLRAYVAGGSALPFPLIERMRPFFPNCRIIADYGLSELGSAITLGDLNSDGTNGFLVSFAEGKVVNSLGEALGPNEVGEILLRVPFKWQGYYNNPTATKEIYDEERWIHSGDLGYFNENGEIFIIDRIKDILKYNNFHFYPTEIEKVISEIPDVSEVCVCGLPDIVSSFLPTAAIVRVVGSNLTEKEVFDYVAKHMDHFKQLRGGVYFVDQLPKGPSGKVLRREVVRICEELREKKVTAA